MKQQVAVQAAMKRVASQRIAVTRKIVEKVVMKKKVANLAKRMIVGWL